MPERAAREFDPGRDDAVGMVAERRVEGAERREDIHRDEALGREHRVREPALRQRVTVTTSGISMQLEPFQRDWSSVVAMITASAVELISEGDPKRLKTCTNPACSWMFYDNTINRSKQFCSTSPCASLVRVRRFRQRD